MKRLKAISFSLLLATALIVASQPFTTALAEENNRGGGQGQADGPKKPKCRPRCGVTTTGTNHREAEEAQGFDLDAIVEFVVIHVIRLI